MAEMSSLDKKILEEVDYLRERYFTFDEPVPFGKLFLYPVKMRNYNEFISSSACLTLNKYDDVKGIKFTHLEYLLNKIKDEKEGPMWALKLTKIIELCLHIKPGVKCSKCGKYYTYNEYFDMIKSAQKEGDVSCKEDGCDGSLIPSLAEKKNENGRPILVIDGIEIDNDAFVKMRKYIMYQNLPDFKDDSWVDKAIRDDQKKRAEIESQGRGTASTERKIIALAATTSYKIDELFDMSVRKFNILIGLINDLTEYKITKQGLMSGLVKLENGKTIDHWLYKKESGLYGSAVDSEGFSNKINSL